MIFGTAHQGIYTQKMQKRILNRHAFTRGLFLVLMLCCSTRTLSDDDRAVEGSYIPHSTLLKWEEALHKLESQFGCTADEYALIVSIPEQELRVVKGEQAVRLYKISTSKYGTGNRAGSHKTPVGSHRIADKIGQGAKFGSIFVSRQNTGKTAKILKDNKDVREDLKTTRILRLEGLEPGINKGEGIDTYNRYIYIHGTQEEGLIGIPSSNGCIRMRNNDVIELFELVEEGTFVEIHN
jgi:hypothetical protein